jgi:RIO kinase 1
MELITDEDGQVAPRLNDISMSAAQAREDHLTLMYSIMRMLCAGIVHGDLSEFNVLVDENGPVIIDLPQAVNAAANNNAQSMLERDVRNITRYYAQYAPELLNSRYDKEIWSLFENGELQPDTKLTGYFEENTQAADVDGVMLEIKAILAEEQERQQRLREEDE